MRSFSVKTESGLLEYLLVVLSDSKRTRIKQLLKFGAILVNGKPVTQFNYPLRAGDQVSVKSARDERPVNPPEFGVEILFQDEAIVVINKPAGLLSVATEKEGVRTAAFAVSEYLNNLEIEKLRQTGKRDTSFRHKPIYAAYRLDQAASGLMVFTKTEESKHKLQANWDRTVKKYFVVVEGVPSKKIATLKSYLHESVSLRVYSGSPEDGGKLAISHYELMRASSHYAILEVKIDTGHKHQIRVQLADCGHPIAGDERYGSRTNPVKRLALHGSYLAFTHPVSGKQMSFHSSLPRTFDQILNQDKLKR